MYQVLYTKYRPRSFADVIGQPLIVRALKNQVAEGKTGNAYLFTGVRGTGKTTCARIFAKAINCSDPQDGEACGRCPSCTAIDGGSVLDIVEVDAASNTGVDYVRQLREEAVFAPALVKYRVYIIDEAHMLSGAAFNALLKILEEPPGHVKFILATTEAHKLPVTVLSRCQRYDFRRIGASDIAQRLLEMAGKEGIDLRPDGAETIARAGDGSARDAISLLQLCSAGGESLTAGSVEKILGLVSGRYLSELAEAFLERDFSAATQIFERIYAEGIDPSRLCTRLTEYFYDLLSDKLGGQKTHTGDRAYETLLQRFTFEQIISHIDSLIKTQTAIARSETPRLEVQLMIVRLCCADPADTPALLGRIVALEKQISAMRGGGPFPVTSQPAEPQQEKPGPSIPEPAAKTTAPLPSLLERWDAVMEEVKRSEIGLYGILAGSRAYESGERLLIASPNPLLAELLKQDGNSSKLRQCVDRALGPGHSFSKLGLYRGPEETPAAKKTPLDKLAERAGQLDIKVRMI